MTAFCAAADWGTTRLRVWLLDASGKVLAERRGDEGMSMTARDTFAATLEKHLGEMGAPESLPVVICGMAGARQGWVEAPYVKLPTAVNGAAVGAIHAPGARREVRIIPGLAQERPDAPDVMRGEETQLAGLSHLLERGRHLVCMPGTHSKWVEVEDGGILGFRTYLTGELFSVLSAHSILRHSLAGANTAIAPDNPVFLDWLKRSAAAPEQVTASLFSIRASGLLFGMPPDHATAALSGLLIGAEIGAALQNAPAGGDVIVVASGSLPALYAAGIETAGRAPRLVDGEAAVRDGLWQAAKLLFATRGVLA